MLEQRDGETVVETPERADPAVFRAAMRRHAGGVAVVTVAGPDGPHGITVTSLIAASLNPPLLSFYVNREARCWPALSRAAHVGVHLLAVEHRDLAALFARPGADRFGPWTRWWPGPAGVPLLADVAVRLVCARHEVLAVGDHSLVVVEVLGAEHESGVGGPLLYAYGEFGGLSPLGEAGVPGDALELDER